MRYSLRHRDDPPASMYNDLPELLTDILVAWGLPLTAEIPKLTGQQQRLRDQFNTTRAANWYITPGGSSARVSVGCLLMALRQIEPNERLAIAWRRYHHQLTPAAR